MNLKMLARYPILPEAREALALCSVSIDEFIESEYLEMSTDRIKAAMVGGAVRVRHTSLIAELASYYGAMLIASCMKSRNIRERLSNAEASVMAHSLRDEPVDIKAQFYSLCGVEFDGDYIDMVKYISIAPKGDAFRLVNRDVYGGRVYVSDSDKCALLHGCLKELIIKNFPTKVPKEIVNVLRDTAKSMDEYDKSYRESSYGDVDILNFPPCILALYNSAVIGENIPHVGRFALATFLHTIGVPVESIIDIFTQASKSADTTRYQIEHVTSAEYTPPSCDAMKSGGVCVAKCGCRNPLNFYKKFGE